MMISTVNAALEALLPLKVRDAQGQEYLFEAAVDTGFNGLLTLPPTLIAALGLSWLCRQQGQAADGSVQVFDVYTATVIWDGQPRVIEVDAADAQPLLGMSQIRGYALLVEVVPGGLVSLTVIP